MKKNKNINWVNSTYTIDQLIENNKHIIPITLRVRLKKLIENGDVVELGTIPSKMGRPKLLLYNGKVTMSVLHEAISKNVCLHEKYQIMFDTLRLDISESKHCDEETDEESNENIETFDVDYKNEIVLENNLDY